MQTGDLQGSKELVGVGQEWYGSTVLSSISPLTSWSSPSATSWVAKLGWISLRTRYLHSSFTFTYSVTVKFLWIGFRFDTVVSNCWWQTAFTTKKDYGKEEREAQWALAQRTLHGLQPPETSSIFNEKSSYRELSEIAEQAKRRAEVAR